jgi:hypothetical protein
MKRRLLALTLAGFVLGLGGQLGAQAPAKAAGEAETRPAPSADGLRRVVVFPYLDQNGSLPAEQRFALFTVPDMVRITLMEDAGLDLVEKADLESAQALSAEALDGETARRSLATRLGADHYVWGYLVSAGGKLSVFHHIVDTASGRTVHMQFDSLTADAAIFDTLAASAQGFANWIRRSLPSRLVEPVIVEKTVERDVLVDRPVPLPASERGALALGGDLQFFVGELEPYLNLTGGGTLSYTFGKGALEPLRFGLRIDLGFLRQKNDGLFGAGAIAIINPSLDLLLAWPIGLGGGFAFVPELDAGASVIFGRVNDSLISYVRPQVALDLALRLDIVPEFQVAAGLRVAAVFWAWQSQTMLSLMPFIDLIVRP